MQVVERLCILLSRLDIAAAMSSLDSSMHSLSTTCIRDFYGRLVASATERREFLGARGLTVFFGVLGTGAAMLIAAHDIMSLWDLFMGFMGLFTGSLSGLFLLGLFVGRSHGRGVLAGAIVSACAVYVVAAHTAAHFFLYPMVGVLACVMAGWVFSVCIPAAVAERRKSAS